MTLQSSGQISLQQIAQEFGDDPPHGVSELYNEDEGVPGTGVVSFSTFYDKRDTVELVINSDLEEVNLHAYASAAGWSNGKHLQVTINSGVYVYSSNAGGTALTCCPATEQGFEAGTRVDIINNGYIIGGYGTGATGVTGQAANATGTTGTTGAAGSAGGDAILVSPSGNDITMDLTITNNGTIAGGGGGGGSGGGGSKEVVMESGQRGDSNNYWQFHSGYYSTQSAATNSPYPGHGSSGLSSIDNAAYYQTNNTGTAYTGVNFGDTSLNSWTPPSSMTFTAPGFAGTMNFPVGPCEDISTAGSLDSKFNGKYFSFGSPRTNTLVNWTMNSFDFITVWYRRDRWPIKQGEMEAGTGSGNAGNGSYYNGSTLISGGTGASSSGSGNRACGASGNGGAIGVTGASGNAAIGGATGGNGGAAGHYYKKNASISGSGAFVFTNNGTASGLFA